jgi:hypothetical protein
MQSNAYPGICGLKAGIPLSVLNCIEFYMYQENQESIPLYEFSMTGMKSYPRSKKGKSVRIFFESG